MDSERPNIEGAFEQIDADAVCEQCGTVNPPGTLLCKKCGNNLRDQRLIRMAEEGAPELAGEGVRPRRVLSAGLTVLGLLIILWTALNADKVGGWIAHGFSSAGAAEDDPAFYWGEGARNVYDSLLSEMLQRTLSADEVADAFANPVLVTGDYTGRYVFKEMRGPLGRRIGTANVRQNREAIYFVALLDAHPEVELRGQARLKDTGMVQAKIIGVKVGDRFESALGYAEPNEAGGLDCFGLSDRSTDYIEVVAYRVP
ncbi:MAG: hypothetical protein JXR94_04795 [Candidatus Hydrogenedentes bacterium]|nr:hypothetical protein [Candidatus Hydrogenedentota bacterium]